MYESFLGVNPWTAVFILLNTLTIFFVAKKYLFAPVMNIIAQRQQEIDGMYASAGKAQKEAEALRNEYHRKLSAARQSGENLVREAVIRGQRKEEEIIRKAGSDAAAIMAKASADIAMEKKKAVSESMNEIAWISIAIARKVVGRELKEADHSAIIDRFIAELGDGV